MEGIADVKIPLLCFLAGFSAVRKPEAGMGMGGSRRSVFSSPPEMEVKRMHFPAVLGCLYRCSAAGPLTSHPKIVLG